MTQRLWQGIALILGIVLIVAGAVAVVVFVQRTANQPRPTPTPSPTARPSPSPSRPGLASPSSGTSPGSSVTGSGEPTLTPVPTGVEPSASPEPSPSTSAEPTPRASISSLEFTFENVGLDDPDAADARPRAFSFFTDARGDVRAAISGTTGGSARICLHLGPPTQILTQPLCFEGRNGFVRTRAIGGQHRQWTVSVSGRTAGRGPTTDVTVAYQGREARVIAKDFRFEGTEDPTRNGLMLRFTPRRDGPMFVDATFEREGGAPTDYLLKVRDLGPGTDVIEESASGTSVRTSGQLNGNDDYRLQLQSSSATAAEGVRVKATIVWP